MKDAYLTIEAPTLGEFKDKGSKFIAYSFPVETETDIAARVDEIRKEHNKARHHCYAYRLGLDNNVYRANDDGEPSGTAGRPILGQIDSFGLTNVLVVVVRYFGGILLGVSGLIQAYKLSTHDALQQATIIEKIVEDVYEITFDYALMSDVMNALKKLHLIPQNQNFGETGGSVEISIRKSEVDTILVQLKAHIAKVSEEEASQLEKIAGLTIAPKQ